MGVHMATGKRETLIRLFQDAENLYQQTKTFLDTNGLTYLYKERISIRPEVSILSQTRKDLIRLAKELGMQTQAVDTSEVSDFLGLGANG